MTETYPKNYYNVMLAGMQDAADLESIGRPTNNGYSVELIYPKNKMMK